MFSPARARGGWTRITWFVENAIIFAPFCTSGYSALRATIDYGVARSKPVVCAMSEKRPRGSPKFGLPLDPWRERGVGRRTPDWLPPAQCTCTYICICTCTDRKSHDLWRVSNLLYAWANASLHNWYAIRNHNFFLVACPLESLLCIHFNLWRNSLKYVFYIFQGTQFHNFWR